jgi:hypothetical protein
MASSLVEKILSLLNMIRALLFARYVYVSDHGHAYEDIARPVLDQGIRKINAEKETWENVQIHRVM